jgi:hypothetical protein
MRLGRVGLPLAALAVLVAVLVVVPSALASPSVPVHLRGYGPAQVVAGTSQGGAIDLDTVAGQPLVFSATHYAFYDADLPPGCWLFTGWDVYEGSGDTQPSWLDGQTTSYTVPAGVDTVTIYAHYAPVDTCDYLP